MKRSYLIAGALVLFVSIILYVTVLMHSTKPKQAHFRESARGADEVNSAGADPVADPQEEVRRLRAEVKAKDNLIRFMSVQSRVADNAPAPAPTPSQSPGMDRIAQVCGILDERIITAPVDSAGSGEMKRALQEVIDSGALGRTEVTSLHCSGTMCKVALTGESDTAVEASTKALIDGVPKLFAASRVYTTETGERAMYLAKSREDLTVDVDKETRE